MDEQTKQAIRQAVAAYMIAQDLDNYFGGSQGTGSDLRTAERKLAELLDVPAHADGSGYDFSRFRTGQ